MVHDIKLVMVGRKWSKGMAESGSGKDTMQNDSLCPGPIIIPGGGTKALGGGIPIAMGGGGPIRPEKK